MVGMGTRILVYFTKGTESTLLPFFHNIIKDALILLKCTETLNTMHCVRFKEWSNLCSIATGLSARIYPPLHDLFTQLSSNMKYFRFS